MNLLHRILLLLICLAPLGPTLAETTGSSHAVILQYHHVSTTTPAVTSISPERFAEHLEYLNKEGFSVWPLPKIIEYLQTGQQIPDKTVVITFDDAFTSIYDNAFPALKKYNMPFTVFVATDPVDRKFGKIMSWKQLREMAESGATLANHTRTHSHVVERGKEETEAAWLSRVKADIEYTQKRLKEETGQDIRYFAWPYGESVPELRQMLKEMGYIGFGQQSGPASLASDMTNLPRFAISGNYTSINSLRSRIYSLPLPLVSEMPDSPLITDNNPPVLKVELMPGKFRLKELQCFASGHGVIPVLWLNETRTSFSTTAPETLPVGRSRYNCTMPSWTTGRFHWYSHAWLRLKQDGTAID
ncbi:polysaccharide deacetylase family protein [Spongorhabdus nitratireducens]